ncbi:MAG: hypothetical protein ABI165_00255 [Bryobacteraceae bacterium]
MVAQPAPDDAADHAASGAGALAGAGAAGWKVAEPAEIVAPAPPVQAPQDKRIFGVLPNYRTTESSIPFAPITAKQKFTIATKDSFDWPVYLVSGAFASLYQLDDSNPGFGQGLKGYARRYGTSYADQAIGNLMTEALVPSLLHEDPRYFRMATGRKWHRAGYAISRVMVTRTDRGNWRFNYSEWVGNGTATAISNLYYPDNRDFSDNAQKLCVQVATDAFSNVLKEFWPDLKQHVFHRHGAELSGEP